MGEIRLTGKQRKAADRVGGVELMIPWPPGLPEPLDLADDEERDATPAEFDAARGLLDPQLATDGIAIRGVKAVRTRWLGSDYTAQVNLLAVHCVGFRWFDAARRGEPPIAWCAQAPWAPQK